MIGVCERCNEVVPVEPRLRWTNPPRPEIPLRPVMAIVCTQCGAPVIDETVTDADDTTVLGGA